MGLFRYILASRAVYALLWFYLSPLLPAMSRDLHVAEAQLGFLPAAFIAGAAAAQIPASVLGSKIGDVKTAGIGLFLLGLGSALTAASPTWGVALALRAVAGVGAGLFFSTAGAALVALRPGEAGRALGLYNASFNIGAFLGYYWGYVAGPLGWRAAAAIPGAIAAAMALPLIAQGGFRHGARPTASALWLGLASFPLWGAVYAANSLAASWLHYYRGLPASEAGAITSASMLSGLLGGSLGSVYDKARDKRAVFLYSAALSAAAMAALPYLPSAVAPLLVFMYGAAYTVYITAIYAEGSRRGPPSSALAVINVVDMALGLNISYIFSFAMAASPPSAWEIDAGLALASALATPALIRDRKAAERRSGPAGI
ncbi:MAG: MFS transporter [Thermoproteus sp.]